MGVSEGNGVGIGDGAKVGAVEGADVVSGVGDAAGMVVATGVGVTAVLLLLRIGPPESLKHPTSNRQVAHVTKCHLADLSATVRCIMLVSCGVGHISR